MTYGWAILVVLAAIGALAYFGILDPGRWLSGSCTLAGGFSCIDYKITNSTITLHVQNNLGTDADNVNVTMTSNDCTQLASGATVGDYPTDNGQKVNSTTGLDFACSLGSKSKFRGIITVTYKASGKEEFHTASGSLSGPVE